MPANKKYLNQSPWHQGAKITAGLIGGYIITALFHMCIALLLPAHKEVLISGIVTFFIVWCVFLILPFLFKNGFKAWLLYIIVILALYAVFTFANQQNPFV